MFCLEQKNRKTKTQFFTGEIFFFFFFNKTFVVTYKKAPVKAVHQHTALVLLLFPFNNKLQHNVLFTACTTHTLYFKYI